MSQQQVVQACALARRLRLRAMCAKSVSFWLGALAPCDSAGMAWKVELSAQAERWYLSLGREQQRLMAARFDRLEERGPALARPFVDSVKGSRHHNMKELRSGSQRALFAFDPRRSAVVLLGGDKAGQWKQWYARNISAADRLFDEHLRGSGGGGRLWREIRAGARSAVSGR